MQLKKIIFIVVMFLTIILYSLMYPAQKASNPFQFITHPIQLTSEQMTRDLDYLNEIVTEVHPKTFGGVPVEVQQAFRKAYNDVQYVENVQQFYFLTQQVMNALQDGHTTMLFPDGPRMDNLPFSYAWLEDGIYVTSGSGWLHRGDKIIEIAGKNERELISMLSSFFSADNVYSLKTRVNLNNIFTSLPYLQYFGLIERNEVQLVVDRDGKVIQGKQEIKKMLKFKSPFLTRDRLDYTIYKDDDLAVLHIDSFAALDEETMSVIRNFFIDVKKERINHVAIDLRFNSGGTTLVGHHILSFMDAGSYRGYSTVSRYSMFTSDLIHEFPVLEPGLHKHDGGVIQVELRPERFTGKLFVITSNQTYSAATDFATIVQDNDMGIIIGDPPGGKPNSYGSSIVLQLPESKLKVAISYKWFERPDKGVSKYDADSLAPDIYVPTTFEDLAQGRDPQLEMIKKLIREERQQERIPLSLR
ncbi:S41 family peptidase [Paenibacillus thiaminolyticus]|uniref:S41 family peptidase n=1 Tax=Paenibacillus thiaminolyticus TaxID=49283 RepID=UPI0025439BE4|nr:S41 family peptidase [Paenibacillus thiaminolyticus]WII35888.1 S41 family peptidase [Paenibacillus thiaminolyticus]